MFFQCNLCGGHCGEGGDDGVRRGQVCGRVGLFGTRVVVSTAAVVLVMLLLVRCLLRVGVPEPPDFSTYFKEFAKKHFCIFATYPVWQFCDF